MKVHIRASPVGLIALGVLLFWLGAAAGVNLLTGLGAALIVVGTMFGIIRTFGGGK